MVRASWSLLAGAAALALLAAPASAQNNWLDVSDPSITQQPTLDERRSGLPELPRESIQAKEEGVVVATLCVNERGAVSNVELTEPSAHRRLNDTTRRWLQRARMNPAQVDGKPVAVCGYTHSQVWTQLTPREIRELEQQRGN